MRGNMTYGKRRGVAVSSPSAGRLALQRSTIGLVMAACTVLAVPVAAQELVLYGPQEVAEHASAPSATGSRRLVLLSHDEGAVRVMRAWYPPDVKLEPHGQMKAGMAAIVTVLAGDMKLAMGSEYDESKLKDLPVGSVFVLTHDNAAHFAKTGPAGAQLLLVIGPDKDLNAGLIGRK